MIDRILTRKNLLILAVFAAIMHTATSVLQYFLNFSSVSYALFDAPILLLAVCFLVYVGRNQTPFRFQNAQTLLVLFFIWLLISCLSMSIANNNDWTSYNSEVILNTAVAVLLCFSLGFVLAREKKPALCKWLLHAALIGWSLFILWVLMAVYQGSEIALPNGGYIFTREDSALLLNCNPNTTGAWEMLAFLGCWCMVLCCKKTGMKILYGCLSVLHYMALILSCSRACIYASLAGFIALAGIAAYLILKRLSFPRRIAIALAVGLAAGAAFFFLQGSVFRLLPTVSSEAGAEASQNTQTFLESKNSKIASTVSVRLDIWKCALEGVSNTFRSFLFGYTPRSVPDVITQISQGRYTDYYSHNQFVEIAASMGVPGLILFLAWLFLIVKDMFILVFRKKDASFLLGIPVIILMLLLANMVEAILVFYHFPNGYIFFFLCGILHGAANAPMPGGHPRLKAFFAAFRETKK